MDGLKECNRDANKKVGVELLYNSVKTGSQLVWRLDQLDTRCSRESQHPAEWALRPPIEQLQVERRCWIEEHVPEKLGPQVPCCAQ